jgi:hypothetical protein
VARKPPRSRKKGRSKARARASKARAAKSKRKNRRRTRKPNHPETKLAAQNVVRAGLGPGFMVTLKRGPQQS